MSAGRPTRILVADDHGIVRHGVRSLLDGEPDFTIVAEARDGAEALALARDVPVDLAVLDVAMPRMTGLQAATEMSRRWPAMHILMLSMYDNDQYFFAALKAGASGYVLKSVADRDLVGACRAAVRGEPFIYSDALGSLMREYVARADRGEQQPTGLLTPREAEVVKLIAEGRSSREIAALLVISVKTVERHRENVLQKLRMQDRTQLTRYAIKTGLIEP
ncbi:two component transcriptional regulator, LuxR family [Geodermatophilus dictyosporus]|uniref:Two component transcriptional regulator, LuxR family n=1 Tax=Geodermatophilus dictyosporus TaxID=1523247 RepID=A0A1I5JUC6_9ACTN|nr:response regulator transcription factor [Geodermatophilus dictyosporus]SFO76011.1 two component transcriptional regulator, LuxR family [Geodermatophilus dictyosporus]